MRSKIYSKFFNKVCLLFMIFILVVGCSTLKFKPSFPSAVNIQEKEEKAISNKKRDIAISGYMFAGDKDRKLIIKVRKALEKYTKSDEIDYIEVIGARNLEMKKAIVKPYYKILFIINRETIKPDGFLSFPKYEYTIKAIDLERDKRVYDKKITTDTSLPETCISIIGFPIDFPLALSWIITSGILSDFNKKLVSGGSTYFSPFSSIITPTLMQWRISHKFKEPSQEFMKIIKGKYQRPSNLRLIVEFNDKNSYKPNNILEAGEVGKLHIKLINEGKEIGPAYETNLILTSNNQSINLESKRALGQIAPGEIKKLTIPISCDLQAKDGKAKVTVNAKEQRGYDAQPVQIVIPVKHIEKPKLKISDVKVNDANLGLAEGNGNGVAETGETIELITYIKNAGRGIALDPSLDLDNVSYGIKTIQNHVDVGKIKNGATEKAKVVIHIPRNFSRNSLEYTLSVKESRGACKPANKSGSFSIGKLTPNLNYSLNLSKKLRNGESGYFNSVLRNDGNLNSKNVKLEITENEPEVFLKNNVLNISELNKNESSPQLTTNITVGRTFSKPSVHLSINITQIDFRKIELTKNLPVKLVEPNIQIVDRTNLGKEVMQNTIGGELILSVANTGELNAENIRMSVSTSVDKVKFRENAVNIGTVWSNASSDNKKFIFDVPQGVEIGKFPIKVKATQKDFPSIEKQLDYRILERGAAITSVVPDESVQDQTVSAPTRNEPTEIISNIKNGSIVYSSELNINITAVDNDGLASLNIFLNGKNIFNSQINQSARISDKSINFNTTRTDLIEGTNIIKIEAEDNENVIKTKNIKVVYKRDKDMIVNLQSPSDVDVNFPKGKAQSNSVALIIGIKDYQYVSPALFADRDAIAFKKFCLKTLGIPEENIILLTNEEATLAQIKKAITYDLKKRLSDGNIYIFYSGHGIPDKNGHPYILPTDGKADNPEVLELVCYPLNDLYKTLDNYKVKHITIFIDACFSGYDKKDNTLIAYAKPVVPTINPSKVGFSSGKITQLNSSAGGQFSTVYEEKKHGLFTYFLLKGLKGKADSNNDNSLTMNEISNFVSRNVKKLVHKWGRGEQIPNILGKDKEYIILEY